MKKAVILIFSWLLCSVFLNASEIQTNNVNKFYLSHHMQLEKVDKLNLTEGTTIAKEDLTNYSRRGGGSSGSIGVWISGIVLMVAGVLVTSGGGAMTYLSAEGLHLGTDDPKIDVYFWNNNDRALGYVCLGFGITFVALGSVIFLTGLALTITGFLSMAGNRHAKLFIEPRGTSGETAVGLSYKL